MQFNDIQRFYLTLFSYFLVPASRNVVVATGNTTNVTTSFSNPNCGLAHFITNQTYNCTIGTGMYTSFVPTIPILMSHPDCPFRIQSNSFVPPMLIQGPLYDE